MAAEYRSETFDCKDSHLTVFVDPDNWDGIIMLEGVRTDYDANGERVAVDFEIEASNIERLIVALMEAKAAANQTSL